MAKFSQYHQRARKLERRSGNRPPYPRVLIVCEGETEPNYFQEIRQKWRISSLHWEIVPCADGSGPEKVVNKAEQKAQREEWEEVYCVFDRDNHYYFADAISKAQMLNARFEKKGKEFKAIPSNPCFELWFLLHFQEHTREEHRDVVRHLLEKHVPGYRKGCTGRFKLTMQDIEKACRHAKILRERKIKTGNDNPSTDVDLLVTRLDAIGKLNPLFKNIL